MIFVFLSEFLDLATQPLHYVLVVPPTDHVAREPDISVDLIHYILGGAAVGTQSTQG